MPQSMYEALKPEKLLGIIETFPVTPMISDKYFIERPSNSMECKWDVIANSYPMAPISSMGSPAPNADPANIKKMTAVSAVIKHKAKIEAEDMAILRNPGSISDPVAERLLLKYTTRINLGVNNRKEWLRMRSLLGMISYTSAKTGVSFVLNLGMQSSHKPENLNTDRWTDLTNSDPMGQIQNDVDLISLDGGVTAAELIMNRKTFRLLSNNKKFRDLLSANLGESQSISQRISSYLKGENLNIVIVDGIFTDEDGSTTQVYPDNYYTIFAPYSSSFVEEDATFVWIDAINEYTYKSGKYTDVIETKDPKGTAVLAGLHGLPAIQYPDRVVTRKVA